MSRHSNPVHGGGDEEARKRCPHCGGHAIPHEPCWHCNPDRAGERADAFPGLADVIAWCEEQRAYCWPPHLADAPPEELDEKRGPCAAYGAVVYGLVIDRLRALRAAQPEAGNEEGERLRRERDHWKRRLDETVRARNRAEHELALLRAAHPEADRAPGEVETVAREGVPDGTYGGARPPADGGTVQP